MVRVGDSGRLGSGQWNFGEGNSREWQWYLVAWKVKNLKRNF